jgi:hypothetical protein
VHPCHANLSNEALAAKLVCTASLTALYYHQHQHHCSPGATPVWSSWWHGCTGCDSGAAHCCIVCLQCAACCLAHVLVYRHAVPYCMPCVCISAWLNLATVCTVLLISCFFCVTNKCHNYNHPGIHMLWSDVSAVCWVGWWSNCATCSPCCVIIRSCTVCAVW